MKRKRIALFFTAALAASSLVVSNARATECPLLWTVQQSSIIYGPFDPNAPPSATTLPESPFQSGYIAAAAIHVVASATGTGDTLIDTKAFCRDLSADSITNAGEKIGADSNAKASGSVADGSLTMSEVVAVNSGGLSKQSVASIQIGFRDVLHADAPGTDLVPVTLRRVINGLWTLDEGNLDTLDRFASRKFLMTIWERTVPSSTAPVWTRRLYIEDQDLDGFLNGEETYPFEVLPGRDLVLSLVINSGATGCQGGLTYGDPPVVYDRCYSFFDFGDEFGTPITLRFEPGAGVTLTADSGFTTYLPEPCAAGLAGTALFALLALRQRAKVL